ncbi:MAG: methyltransferase domain-containing protein [Candidatus Eisenbacteria bacterium]|nr:methyltransferase domain-containing protein [Candidatus Eisenbacteria bacterium]MCC7141853.1 methyltransferase domain-containing protein [Candidatus Eisenbacteria bacterium]
MSERDRNPQAAQMADESMVRNLAAQAEAIWPQEVEFFRRYPLGDAPEILDLACGTGEISMRLARLFPRARILGVDLISSHLDIARARCAADADRVSFEVGDAFHLSQAAHSFDLVVCRHLLQAIPEYPLVLAEMIRVTRPGGRVHIVAEDYAMMHFDPMIIDTDLFWHQGPIAYAGQTGCDLRSGRKIFGDLRRLGLSDVRVDYLTLDTVRVPRDTLAAIWTAWRDGYAASIAEHTDLPHGQVLEAFEQMIAAIRNSDGYAVWHLPLISARVP